MCIGIRIDVIVSVGRSVIPYSVIWLQESELYFYIKKNDKIKGVIVGVKCEQIYQGTIILSFIHAGSCRR